MSNVSLNPTAVHAAISDLETRSRNSRYVNDPVLWAEEVLGVVLWSSQKEILRSIVTHKKTAVKSCHAIGKGVTKITPVPTPQGMRLFGDLQVGDYVLDVHGNPTLVTYVSPDKYLDNYEVVFDDGSVIHCDADHLWQVQDLTARRRKVTDWRDHWDNTDTKNVVELRDTLRTDSGQYRWRVPVSDGLQRPHNDNLPLDPYALGVWLGDGSTGSKTYCGGDTKTFYADLLPDVTSRRENKPGSQAVIYSSNILRDGLERAGVLRTKHIPHEYLWNTSWEQRKALLAGIMDSDGFVGTSNGIDLTDKRLSDDVMQLLYSLGVKASRREGVAAYTKDGKRTVTGTRYRMSFTTSWNPFRNRGENWTPPKTSKHTIRTIVDIRPVDSVVTRCITVDNDLSCFLVGNEFIPTHNTFISAVAACWWVSTRPNSMVRSTAPTYRQVHELLWEEIRKFHGQHKLVGRITQSDEWKRDLFGTEIQVGSGSKPADGDIHGFHGVHRPDGVLVILDEACHDAETEVLSDRGWVSWADVQPTDKLLTMDQTTRQTEYLVPEKLIAYQYAGKMALYEAKGANYMVTPNHEMLFKTRKNSSLRKKAMEDFTTLENVYMEKSIAWVGERPDVFTLPAHGRRGQGVPIDIDIEDWAEFLGWFASEGSIDQRISAVSIAQRKTDTRDDIRALLERMPFKYFETENGFGISSVQLAEHLATFGRTCDVKRVPTYVKSWSPELIEIFVTAFRKGDGYMHGTQGVLYTSCKDMADDLHELVLKMDLPSVIRERELAPSYYAVEDRYITPSRNGWVVTVPPKRTDIRMRNESLSYVDYDGMVYCATMPKNNTLFTRRKGYTLWSGNCGVPDTLFTASDAITTGAGDRVLAVGNPDDPETEFGRIFKEKKMDLDTGEPIWNLMTVSAFDTPLFTDEWVPDVVRQNLIQPKWVRQREFEWGIDSGRYKSKILAEFPDQSNDAFFSQKAIDEAHNTTIPEDRSYVILGVDIAGHGDDDSVIYENCGGRVRFVDSWSDGNVLFSAKRVVDVALRVGAHEVRIDGSGLGAAIVDMLPTIPGFEKFRTIKVMGGNQAQDTNAHRNARAEQYDNLRREMQLGNIDLDAEDEKINKQMLAIKYSLTQTGSIQIESKRDMHKRGVKSPDELDAVVYATFDISFMFAPPKNQMVYEDPLDALGNQPDWYDALPW